MQAAHAVHVSEAWWTEACKKVKNAVIFIDNYTSECLHWSGGLTRLVNAGAKNVKEFSSFEVKYQCMAINVGFPSYLIMVKFHYLVSLLTHKLTGPVYRPWSRPSFLERDLLSFS